MTNLSHITHFGLPGIDRIPFGMHACHFYSSRDELVGALVPYFVAGLRGNERCLWVTAPPLPAREAYMALRRHDGVDDAIKGGALLVLDFDQWYASSAGLKGHDVVELWLKEEERALAEGYNGLRIAGNMSFLKSADWSTFIEYEHAVTTHFKTRRIVALCSYMHAQSDDQEMSNVLHAHHWALRGSESNWKWVSPPQFPMSANNGCDQVASKGITKEPRAGMRPDSQAASRADGSKASAPIIRVLIAEDHTTLRYTLRSILQRYPEIDIIGEATNGEEAVVKAKELEPAIVLMDISMPRVDGIEATRRIKAQFTEMAVLGLSVDTGGYSVNAILKAGAVAVVPKEKVLEDLYPAIQQALHHRSQAELPRERSLPLTQIP